jgi:hypothetical protein
MPPLFFNIKSTGASTRLIKARIYPFISILLIYCFKTLNFYSNKLYRSLNRRSPPFVLIVYSNLLYSISMSACFILKTSLYSLNSAGSFKARIVFTVFIKHSGLITLVLNISIIKTYGASFISFLNFLGFKILRSFLKYLKRQVFAL